jgi:hypothetical protein
LFGQTSRGTVTGLISDPSGAAVSNASVELRDTATNVTRSTTSNESALYRFDAVDPGPYEISVTAPGFSTARVSEFQVAAGQVASIDVRLEVGALSEVVSVTSEGAALQTEAPVRGGTISSVAATELPVASRNPATLALTLPGVSSNRNGFGVSTFSVNGSRGRSNNFMIDGTENNDISVSGQAFQITNPDVVQETNVQTSNFDSEYGRAGGAVVNVITKAGTNSYHGTASYLLESTYTEAISNLTAQDPEVLARGRPLPGTEQIWSGTLGGKIIRDRTFFFVGFQNDRQSSSGTQTYIVPSAAGRATLNSIFPKGTNKNVDLYNVATGAINATSQFFPVALGNGRPDVEFGTGAASYPNIFTDRQWTIRIDHKISDRDLLMGRYSQQDSNYGTASVSFPGFNTTQAVFNKNTVLTETHVFSPALTNELRIPYNRIGIDAPLDTQDPLGKTLATYAIAGINSFPATVSYAFGVQNNLPQGRIANNYGLQDTITYTRGSHSIRAGIDLLDQRSRQFAPIVDRGQLVYQADNAHTGFANFVDDFGGSGGTAQRDFGSARYYPTLFRQQYFAQDRWRVNASWALSFGLRYEYFGVPINSVRTPAFTGLFNVDPVTLTGPYNQPDSVKPDKNNFSPSFGFAYSPDNANNPFALLLGAHRGVIRGGYQIGYDSFFNNIASNAQTSSPNIVSTLTTSSVSSANPRGVANFSAAIPAVARALTPLDAQSLVVGNLVNPYYQKASLGVQRELPGNFILDAAYVWTKGTKLFMQEDLNPLVPAALRVTPPNTPASTPLSGRLDNLQGSRGIRTNGGSSYYSAGQLNLTRRFSGGAFGTLAYTHSKLIDYGSEIFSTSGISNPVSGPIPTILGGLPRERAVSLFDRPNRLSVTFGYQLPSFKNSRNVASYALGGWEITGVYTYESGVPYTVTNGVDADGIGGNLDRPDDNPAGRKGVRAVPSSSSPTGYVNPDAGNTPIDPMNAQFIVVPAGSGRTGNLGRNTERTNPTDNLNLNVLKRFHLTERFNVELRGEAFNLLNHPQYGQLSVSAFSPGSAGTLQSNATTSSPARFLNQTFLDGGGRVLRYQLKIIF